MRSAASEENTLSCFSFKTKPTSALKFPALRVNIYYFLLLLECQKYPLLNTDTCEISSFAH